MDERDPLRRVARYRLDQLAEDDAAVQDGPPASTAAAPDQSERDAPGAPATPRPSPMAARGAFADELVRQAMARGEFDDLPLTGKPIPGIGDRHDPDWWLKAFIERERITGVLPEALQLRKDDAELDGVLDRHHREQPVREALDEFNARVLEARRQLRGGPPVVTPLRDVDAEVGRWRERRRAREAEAAARAAEHAQAQADAAAERARRRWWRRGLRRALHRGPDGPG